MEIVISEKDQDQDQEEINIEEALSGLYADKTTEQDIFRNTVSVPFDSKIKDFSTNVTYEYFSDDKDQNQTKEYRGFRLDLSRNPIPLHPDLYVIKICGVYLCKNDFLNLYTAFTTVVKTNVDELIKAKKDAHNRIKEKIKDQLEMFKGDFYEPTFNPLGMTLFIKSSLNEMKDIKLSFTLISTPSGYGMLDKKTSLSTQDIYFIYTNYHRIIKTSLDYDYQRKLELD